MEKSLQLKSGMKLFYASDANVAQELKSKDLGGALCSTSDLQAGIYEGGLKIWECAVDLCNYLDESVDLEGLDVLELGCGAALPSIVAMKKGANSVTMQDYNDFVLETFTKKNFTLNSFDLPNEYIKFIPGDWGKSFLDGIGARKFQLILTSETIYNESNYPKLVETMNSLLDDDGKILLAAKIYYFGVGGGIASFGEYLDKHGIFRMEDVWSTTTSSVARKILEIRRK